MTPSAWKGQVLKREIIDEVLAVDPLDRVISQLQEAWEDTEVFLEPTVEEDPKKRFNIAVGAVILLNSLVIGWETEAAVQGAGPAVADTFYIVNNVFQVFFVVELGLRIHWERG